MVVNKCNKDWPGSSLPQIWVVQSTMCPKYRRRFSFHVMAALHEQMSDSVRRPSWCVKTSYDGKRNTFTSLCFFNVFLGNAHLEHYNWQTQQKGRGAQSLKHKQIQAEATASVSDRLGTEDVQWMCLIFGFIWVENSRESFLQHTSKSFYHIKVACMCRLMQWIDFAWHKIRHNYKGGGQQCWDHFQNNWMNQRKFDSHLKSI